MMTASHVVAITRSARPIDLTATLVAARVAQLAGREILIRWLIEPKTRSCEVELLSKFADALGPFFDIELVTLDAVTKISRIVYERIPPDAEYRIHHGAFVDSSSRNLTIIRRGFDEDSLVGRESKGTEWHNLESADTTVIGSLYLLEAQQHGVLAHSPWYVIPSTGNPDISALDLISPPAAWDGRARVRPGMRTGYLMQDYIPGWTPTATDQDFARADFFRSLDWITSTLPPSRLRVDRMKRGAFQAIVDKISAQHTAQERTSRTSVDNAAINGAALLDAILDDLQRCRYLEKSDYFSENSGHPRLRLDYERAEIESAVRDYRNLISRYVLDLTDVDLIIATADGSFRNYRRALIVLAESIVQAAAIHFGRDSKATVEKLLEATSNSSDLVMALDKYISSSDVDGIRRLEGDVFCLT